MTFLPLFLVTMVLLAGCENQSTPAAPPHPPTESTAVIEPREAPAPAVATSADSSKAADPSPAAGPLLASAITPTVVELPTGALPVWRDAGKSRPSLVLLSQDPFLAPLPEQLRDQARLLLLEGSREELLARTASPAADPLLLPAMALSAALEAGLFSRVIWVLPSKGTIDQFDLEIFREQLLGLGAIDRTEAETLTEPSRGVFAGRVRDVPFQAVHLDALPALDEPVVLHIDVSFFAPLYQGEIKTPLYPLLGRIHGTLRDTQWQVLGVTISSANLDGGIPLASRFLTGDIARLYREPDLLDAPLPKSWELRARALYLENFFKKEEVRKLYEDMEAEAPEDSSIKYALYQVLRQFKEGAQALEKLNQAVALDPVYALEYLELANVAKEQNLTDQVQRMLMLAVAAQPENVWLQLQLVGQLKANGQDEEAEKLLTTLREQPWSPVYYPEMVKQLE